MRQLTEKVFVDVGVARCNPSFVVTTEGTIMVDSPELPTDALAWKEEVFRRGEPKYLINLEHHFDHIVGNHFYSPPATVVSHRGTRERYADSLGSPEQVRERIRRIDPEGIPIPADYRGVPPSLTYTEELEIQLGDRVVRLFHMPGHTPNQTVAFVPQEGVMMAGGNVSCRIMPAMWGSQNLEWLKALDRMEAMGPEFIIPVHGEVCGVDYLREFRDLLRSWIEEVRLAIQQGLSKEEAADKINFLGPFIMRPGREPYGQEWQKRNTRALYDELTGSPRTPLRYFEVGRYPKEALGR